MVSQDTSLNKGVIHIKKILKNLLRISITQKFLQSFKRNTRINKNRI